MYGLKIWPKVFTPLYNSSVSCGFPSPAQSYIEASLDLNEHLIKRPASTFFLRAQGDSMQGAGIYDGDLIIIDRSLTPQNNHIVLAALNGEFTLKRFVKRSKQTFLMPENSKYHPTLITPEMDFQIWGVAVHSIRKFY